MRKFTKEYYHDRIAKKPLHKRKKQRRELYAANNARRRGIPESQLAYFIKDSISSPEDALIEMIDLKKTRA